MSNPSEPTDHDSAAPQKPRSALAPILWYEAAERFAFYGLLTALVIWTTAHTSPAVTDVQLQRYIGWMGAAIFLVAFAGAAAAESLLGKFRMVLVGSVVAIAGYGVLALAPAQWPMLMAGLVLVALGTGAVKPCVAAFLGDQSDTSDKSDKSDLSDKSDHHRLPRMFGWFYFAMHGGGLLAVAAAQLLAAEPQRGLRIALVLPLVALVAGTAFFWMGRGKLVQVPAFGRGFWEELFSRETRMAAARLVGVYLIVALFWMAWQQGAATMWPQQAAAMDLRLLNVQLLPEQIATANIVFILLFVPLLSYGVYPMAARFVAVTPLRRIGAGLFLAALSFVVAALLQRAIDGGAVISAGWQLVAWALLTLGEVMLVVAALELSYTWTPRRIQSVTMALWLLTFGAREIPLPMGEAGVFGMSGASHYLFFAGALTLAAVLAAAIPSLVARARASAGASPA